ncbi:MAG: FCD domain-containing protein [Gammaproteobacteria bacterium]
MVVWSDIFAIKRSYDDHHRILRALRDGDSMRAKFLMQEHIRFAGEYLRDHLQNISATQDGEAAD